MWISKRNEPHIKTNIQERQATFNQMMMVQNKVVETDAIYIESIKKNMGNSKYSTHRKYNNSGHKKNRIKCNGETKLLTGKGEKVIDDHQDKRKKKK